MNRPMGRSCKWKPTHPYLLLQELIYMEPQAFPHTSQPTSSAWTDLWVAAANGSQRNTLLEIAVIHRLLRILTLHTHKLKLPSYEGIQPFQPHRIKGGAYNRVKTLLLFSPSRFYMLPTASIKQGGHKVYMKWPWLHGRVKSTWQRRSLCTHLVF